VNVRVRVRQLTGVNQETDLETYSRRMGEIYDGRYEREGSTDGWEALRGIPDLLDPI